MTEQPVILHRTDTTAWHPDAKAPRPKDHPVVLAQRRAVELEQISAWLARNHVTHCPTRFCAASNNVEGVVIDAFLPLPDRHARIDTVGDAARWLRLNAMVGFDRFPNGNYIRNGRIMTADRLIEEVRHLRDTGAEIPKPRKLRARRRHVDPTGGRTAAAVEALDGI